MIDPAEFQETVLRTLRDILPIAMGVLFQAQEQAHQGNVDAEIHALEGHCNTINCYIKTLESKIEKGNMNST